MSVSAPNRSPSLFVMVGDPSADRHAAKIIQLLKTTAPDLHVWGVGGPYMLEAGLERLYNCHDLAVVGIVESAKFLSTYARVRQKLWDEIEKRKPDAVLLIDFGGFNMSLGKGIRKRMPLLPILYFISPQVWASRPWRVNSLSKTVTKMLVIFPFEERYYQDRGVEAVFVGNPLTRNLPDPAQLIDRQEFHTKVGIEPGKHIVGVFPGSREREVTDFFPVTLDGIQQLLEIRDDVDFVVSQVDQDLGERIKKIIESRQLPPAMTKRIHLINSDSNYELMKNADVIWAKSGTTTLEVTLMGGPMLILYRGLWLSYLLVKAFIRVKRVGWPNLLAGESLVPELLQLDCRGDLLVRYTSDLLDVPALRAEMKKKLLALRGQLGQGDYASNCVKEILKAIAPSDPIQDSYKSSQANV